MASASSVLDDPHFPIRGRAVIPVADLLPWAVLAMLVASVLLYLVGAEQGAVAIFDGRLVHEYVHDGRHLLGFPCH